MASIHIVDGRKYWYASFRDAAGKQHFVSTRILHSPPGGTVELERNRETAQALAEEIEKTKRHEDGLLSPRDPPPIPTTTAIPTAEQYLRHWLEEKRKVISSVSYNIGKAYFERFFDCLGDRRSLSVHKITAEDISRFKIQLLYERKLAPRTVNLHLNWVSMAFRAAEEAGIILMSPIARGDFIAGDIPMQPQPVTPRQVEILLMTTRRVDWRTAILFGFYAGMPLSEATSQVWQNINFEAGEIVWAVKTPRNGTSTTKLPLHPVLAKHLQSLPGQENPQGWVTPSLMRLSKGARTERFGYLLGATGIDPEKVRLPSGQTMTKVRFASLQCAFAGYLGKEGITLLKAFLASIPEDELRRRLLQMPAVNVPVAPLQEPSPKARLTPPPSGSDLHD